MINPELKWRYFTKKLCKVALQIAFMTVLIFEAKAQCNQGTTVLPNGSFEQIGGTPGSCTFQNNAFMHQIIENGFQSCVPNWINAFNTPDVFQRFRSGNNITAEHLLNFAGMGCTRGDFPKSLSAPEAIAVKVPNLNPALSYRVRFRARTEGNKPLVFRVFATSGFSAFGGTSNSQQFSAFPTLPSNSVQIFGNDAFSNPGQWTEFTTSAFSGSSSNNQILFLPFANLQSTSTWVFIDRVEFVLCEDQTNHQITATDLGNQTYQFTAANSGNLGNYCWDFGDGTTSNLPTPTHTYANPGKYRVCLRAITNGVQRCLVNACTDVVVETCGCNGYTYMQGTNNWTTPQTVSTNLILQQGARLNVTGTTVRVKAGCRIYINRGARLQLDNSTLDRSQECPGNWAGIHVIGNGARTHQGISAASITNGSYPATIDDHGVFYSKNNSAIKHANNAITTSTDANGYIPPYYANWGDAFGGIIFATNTTFQDNWRAVEMLEFPKVKSMVQSQMENISTFDRCHFYDKVTIWENHNVKFNNCNFYLDASNSTGVFGLNFTARFSGNTFEGIQSNPSPARTFGINASILPGFNTPFDFVIGDDAAINHFNYLRTGAEVKNFQPTSAKEVFTFLNEFKQCNTGLSLFSSKGQIKENTFTSCVDGLQLNQCGKLTVKSSCNKFQDQLGSSSTGSNIIGNNIGWTFINDHYQAALGGNDYSDVYIADANSAANNAGQIKSQGTAAEPVLNLFDSDLNIITRQSTGGAFNYYHPGANLTNNYPNLIPHCDLNFNNCTTTSPQGNFVNISKQKDLGSYVNNCLPIQQYLGPLDTRCKSVLCLADIKSNLASLRNLLLGIHPLADEIAIQNEIWELESYRSEIIDENMHEMLLNSSYSSLVNMLYNDGSCYAMRKLVDFYENQGDISTAKQILENLTIETDDEIAYRVVQQINLNRLEGATKLTEDEANALRYLISGVTSTAAIAEGLLSYYTGEIFDTRKIPMTSNREAKSKEVDTTSSELVVSPNPASTELSIQLPNYFDCANTNVQCFNLQGNLLKTATLSCDNSKIDVSDLTSGFYLLVVKDQHKAGKAKFVKIN